MTTPRESASDTVAIAQMAEDRGIESIWLEQAELDEQRRQLQPRFR
jgi:hypothetical protein